jgi:hypothetical protein
MNTNWTALLHILANREEDDMPILVIIAGISHHADDIRQKETHETRIHIVQSIIMLNKHASESVKRAACACLNDKFLDELQEVNEKVKALQEQKLMQ